MAISLATLGFFGEAIFVSKFGTCNCKILLRLIFTCTLIVTCHREHSNITPDRNKVHFSSTFMYHSVCSVSEGMTRY